MKDNTTETRVFYLTGLAPTKDVQYGTSNLDQLVRFSISDAGNHYLWRRNDDPSLDRITPHLMPQPEYAFFERQRPGDVVDLVVIVAAYGNVAFEVQDKIQQCLKENAEKYQEGSSKRLRVIHKAEQEGMVHPNYMGLLAVLFPDGQVDGQAAGPQ